MESKNKDIKIKMNLLKCDRFKTFQEDPPNRKYLYIKECDSIHGLNIITEDDNMFLNKASGSNDELTLNKDKMVVTKYTKKEEEVAEEEVAKKEIVDEEELLEVEEEVSEGKADNDVAEDEITNIAEDAVEKDKDEEKQNDEKQEQKKKEEDEEKQNEVGEHEIEDQIQEVIKAYTGFFRDNKRRIDIVLVVEDSQSSNTDCIQLDFLTNILRTGLEIEIEPGQMELHKHLHFIKIHASDSVLNEYGDLFAVKRYFVNNRLTSYNIYYKSHETEWLKTMRRNYTTLSKYSNYERSLIVYKILRHLPFGSHVSQYGLHRLLKKNIILDAYALHDGPFYKSNTTGGLTNGRQILYYNWVGLDNLFQSQPLHVIHEYFGPKIAFYYAFYGFYNAALTLASIAGIVSVLMPYIASAEPNKIKQLCKENKIMCPECRNIIVCPKRPLKDYCTPSAINVHLDHPYVLYFSVFMLFWAFTFITIWKRKEYVLNWMWEVGRRDSYYEISKRPEYNIDYKNPRRSAKTGFKYEENGFSRVIRISLSIILIPLCILSSVYLMGRCTIVYDMFISLLVTKKTPTKIRDYERLAIFGTLYTFYISALETVFHFLCYYIVAFENHKSLKEYEEALVTKQFGISITLIYTLMCYYAWLLGNIQQSYATCQYPERYPIIAIFDALHRWIPNSPWYYFEQDYTTAGLPCWKYCWPFTCINELSVLLILILFLKQVVFRVAFNTCRLMTDYNEARNKNEKISCWEREYQLNEFNEAQLTRRYMILAVQFSLITFFVIAFPLAPLVVLVVNAWDIRHSARKLLLASRRPLLIRSPGIGVWSKILLFIAYVAIATNALTLMLTTRQYLREYFQKPVNSTIFNMLFSYYIDVNREWGINCYAPFMSTPTYKLVYKFEWHRNIPKQATSAESFLININSYKFVIIFGFIILCLASVIQNIFKPYRKDIEQIRAMENKIKNLYSHYENIIVNKK